MDEISGAVLEQPTEVTEQPTEVVEQPQEGVPGEELTEAQPEAEVQSDGRTLPKEVQTALKALKEAHPEHAKAIEELRKGYFSSRQHSEFFKSPAEARQAKATLDLAGGAEGISNLQAQAATIEMVDSAFEQGDPQVLDDIIADFPDGFKKLIGPALEKLQGIDQTAYAHAIQPHAVAWAESAGLGQVIEAVNQALASGNLDQAKDLMAKTQAWYQGHKQAAGNRPQANDPERAKFEAERKDFESQREQSFREDIGRDTVANQNEQINRAVAPYLKSKPLGADAKADLMDGIGREVNRMLKADQTYQTQVRALLASKGRDAGRVKQYINATVNEAVPKAVKAVWGRRYGTVTPAKPTAQATKAAVTNPAQAAPIKVSVKPNRNDVDWSKTKDILFITNKAYMKSGPYKGKLVSW